jgi:uncharacterized protein (DUF1778 family)
MELTSYDRIPCRTVHLLVGTHSHQTAILLQALAHDRWDVSTTPPLSHKLGILAHLYASDQLYLLSLLSLLSRHVAARDKRDKAFSGRRSKPPYLRLSPEAKQKLQTAGESAGRTVSEFVLESALVRADEALADRTRFGLDADRWKSFMEALDAPPREIPRVGRLLKEPSVFERGD